jgi:hypothetical protein
MFLRTFHEVPFEETLGKQVSAKYRVAFEWFSSQVGADRTVLFPFVCDLALQTIWNDMPKTEEEWQATSPAWRFVRLTRAIRDGAGPQLLTDELVGGYGKAANELLRICKFSSLEDVTDAALERSDYRKPNMLIEDRCSQRCGSGKSIRFVLRTHGQYLTCGRSFKTIFKHR